MTIQIKVGVSSNHGTLLMGPGKLPHKISTDFGRVSIQMQAWLLGKN